MPRLNYRFLPVALGLSLGCLAPAAPASAQGVAASLTGLLGQASDSALSKLAQPGAFYGDAAIRIQPPGLLGKASGLMKLADQAGLTRGLTQSVNDAAGLAANEAKPIFRAAISRMTLKDGVAIARQSDGATAYLRQSAGGELAAKLQPLVAAALGRTGAFTQLDKLGKSGVLASAGITRDTLTRSVADQALNGIFKYMGTEEASLRADPIGLGKSLLGTIGR